MNKRVAATIAILGVAALPLMPSASAAEGSQAATDEACLLRLQTGEMRCYESPSALFEDLTGRQNTGLTSADLRKTEVIDAVETGIEASQAQASVINAVFYDGVQFAGASLYMEAPSGCDDDTGVEWSWNSLRSDWRNRIVSGRGFGKCDYKVWDYTGYQGASFGYTNFSGTFGAMAGAGESVRMR